MRESHTRGQEHCEHARLAPERARRVTPRWLPRVAPLHGGATGTPCVCVCRARDLSSSAKHAHPPTPMPRLAHRAQQLANGSHRVSRRQPASAARQRARPTHLSLPLPRRVCVWAGQTARTSAISYFDGTNNRTASTNITGSQFDVSDSSRDCGCDSGSHKRACPPPAHPICSGQSARLRLPLPPRLLQCVYACARKHAPRFRLVHVLACVAACLPTCLSRPTAVFSFPPPRCPPYL